MNMVIETPWSIGVKEVGGNGVVSLANLVFVYDELDPRHHQVVPSNFDWDDCDTETFLDWCKKIKNVVERNGDTNILLKAIDINTPESDELVWQVRGVVIHDKALDRPPLFVLECWD